MACLEHSLDALTQHRGRRQPDRPCQDRRRVAQEIAKKIACQDVFEGCRAADELHQRVVGVQLMSSW